MESAPSELQSKAESFLREPPPPPWRCPKGEIIGKPRVREFLLAAERFQTAFVTRNPTDPDKRERGQIAARVVVAALLAVYFLAAGRSGAIPLADSGSLLGVIGAFVVLCLLRAAASLRWPVPSTARTVFGMLCDYGAITLVLCLGDKEAMPFVVILGWLTVVTGVRENGRYLLAANMLAVASLGVTGLVSPYWNAHPPFVVAMLVFLLLGPTYTQMLVIRARREHQAARRATQEKSRFLARASHDLRQPIHAISLFTACLRDTGLGKEQERMVENIDSSLTSVSHMFRSLLNIATLDSGGVKPHPEPVAVQDLLDDIARQNAEAARWAGVNLRVVPCSLVIEADRGLMMTILQNLVSNALKYAPRGRVVIGARRQGATFSLVVCDEGRGIPEPHLDQVFAEFYRVGKDGSDGVGLGLPIVRRMAELMGYGILLTSRAGHGTLVAVTGLVPIASPPAPRPQAVTLLTGMRILLIEDDEDILAATQSLLGKWGCIVDARSTLGLDVPPCDLIVTDFDLPGPENGVECIARVRRVLGRPIPALVVTGHTSEMVGGEGLQVMAKPVRPAELRAVLMAERLRQA